MRRFELLPQVGTIERSVLEPRLRIAAWEWVFIQLSLLGATSF